MQVCPLWPERGLAGTRARRLLHLEAPQILQPDTSVGQMAVSVQGEEGGQGDDVEILGEACAEECYFGPHPLTHIPGGSLKVACKQKAQDQTGKSFVPWLQMS